MTEEALAERASPLYYRYNGIMMGFFLGSGGIAAKRAANRYPVLRERLQEFASEIGVPLDLPEDHAEYTKTHAEIISRYLSALKAGTFQISGLVLLGATAIEYVIQRAIGGETELMRETAHNLMEEFEIPHESLAKFAEAVQATERGISLNSLHAASLGFLKEVLHPLPTEPQTAFVIMPFSKKYRNNFPSFYAPLLQRCGYQAIRAWGGIANEAYFEALSTLIDKCGAVLAEVSELNLNVMYELGYAHALPKLVCTLLEAGAPEPPSNLRGLYIVRYTRDGWPQKAIEECALQFSIVQASVERMKLQQANREPSNAR